MGVARGLLGYMERCQKRHSQDREMKGGEQKAAISMALLSLPTEHEQGHGHGHGPGPGNDHGLTLAGCAYDGTPQHQEAKGSADSQAIGNSIVNDAARTAVGLLAGNPWPEEHHLPCPWRMCLSQNNRTLADEIGKFINSGRPVLKQDVLAQALSRAFSAAVVAN
ncbi:hypothetical protein FDECE_15703 [Fusarium decemcellulare]|nr:hypothetical protein FDECE_15703 [Fusarium decemcellulare]